ncbi:acetylornithine deacetylase [Buchnera aphidicola]|uniref:Acetylornithine deacetylase n=1 Tax=Buchnera aphidicola subsp. Acyrthosiphon pisum (strain 5A) TaxID=563178 RepID=ARGE_BUCA5|nr:acetylornithine deacetylase [Buchnera aphidicola]B8D8K5.1 RecName: Full=Acetylornithine deacetylase; Short=AO; Short=Acetylornithinase; AltName: Full=N-acetylornithinase; Short=NAO [Buchnera aphidicola str. 5A (Acyrthosiphon pisum)]ACL30427.1 acetylornithine deacetylase [Buchnera aphidicola str. 5A (Acyrthosiphon pisum)]OQX98579.1 MAG: acetylornithine deacetylase [Erwiniaceae bacterium 4572_131]
MIRKIPSFIEVYKSLIQIPTISSNNKLLDQSNKNFIDLLSNYFSDLNFSVKNYQIPHTDKYNMLACVGSGNGGLLLSGHSDTVDFDEKKWTKDPFKLTETNNKFYGLGAVDMKGFFALILEVISSINIKKIIKPIYILATANEETDMSGAKNFIQSTIIKPDCIIIGEPTSLKLINAHKGHMSYSIKVIGDTGHSSNPDHGVNSIEIMHDVIRSLLILKKYFKEEYQHPNFSIPYPTMNLSSIHGGSAINRICPLCILNFEIRPIPGLTLTQIEIVIKEKLETIMKKWSHRIFIKKLFSSVPAYECPHNSGTIKIVEKLCQLNSAAVNYCTEAPFLQRIAPTLILGPGSIEQAHQPDEYLEHYFIQPTKNIITKLINKFCY